MSSLSSPAMTLSIIAASVTVLALGPTVSYSWETGMTEARETKPVMVSMPMTLFLLAGLMILPDVSCTSHKQCADLTGPLD